MANQGAALPLSQTRQVTQLVLLALIFAALPLVRATTDPSDGTFTSSFFCDQFAFTVSL